MIPKALGGATSPDPKWWSQMRFAMTRLKSGLRESVIHFARAMRRGGSGASAGSRKSDGPPGTAETPPGETARPGVLGSPRVRTWVTPGGRGETAYDFQVLHRVASSPR